MSKNRYLKAASLTFSKIASNDLLSAIVITAIWKVIISMAGLAIDITRNGAVASLFSHTLRWDSGWYLTVLKDGYVHNAASAAFYPLFPFLVNLVRLLSFNSLDYAISAQIINTVAVVFVIMALLTIGRSFLKPNQRFWLVALVLSAPAAFFIHTFYSEALFMAIGFWAYIFAYRKRWLPMGIALALLTSARLPSILFVLLCGLEFLRTYEWSIRKTLNKNLFYFMMAPMGFLVYGLYLCIVRGDFFAMFHAYSATSDWVYQVFDINIFKTILRAIYQIFLGVVGQIQFNTSLVVNQLLPALSLTALGVSSFYLIKKTDDKYRPLGIFGLMSLVMFTLNSNVVSAHRYALPCLGIYIVIILFSQKLRYKNTILACTCMLGLVVQMYLFSLFITNIFAG